jgi:hypothetical protein
MATSAATDVGDDSGDSARGSYLRRAGALFGLGLLGVATLGVTLALSGAIPDVSGLAPPVVLALSLATPTVLLLAGVLVGTWAAPKVGFRSLFADRVTDGTPVFENLAPVAPRALAAGLGVGLLLVALDVAFAPLGAAPPPASSQALGVWDVLASAPVRFLYGGLTEELMLRWGLLSLVAWVGWRATGGVSRPGPAVMWPAIGITALVFGLGHLPALAGLGPLSPAVVMRTVLLNAVGGVVYGWFFWRYYLEAAMLAHVGTHLTLLTLSAVVALL